MICHCGSDEHEPVKFGSLWGVHNLTICPNDIITEVSA